MWRGGSGIVPAAVVALVALLPAMTSPTHHTPADGPQAAVTSEISLPADPSDQGSADVTDPAVEDPGAALDPASAGADLGDPFGDSALPADSGFDPGSLDPDTDPTGPWPDSSELPGASVSTTAPVTDSPSASSSTTEIQAGESTGPTATTTTTSTRPRPRRTRTPTTSSSSTSSCATTTSSNSTTSTTTTTETTTASTSGTSSDSTPTACPTDPCGGSSPASSESVAPTLATPPTERAGATAETSLSDTTSTDTTSSDTTSSDTTPTCETTTTSSTSTSATSDSAR